VHPFIERGDESFGRFSSVRQVEVAAAGRVPEYEYWYQPKDETAHEQLFLVPEGKFDALQIYVDAYITKSIDEFAPTRWEMSKEGMLTPTLVLKQRGWDKDHPERVVPFEPETNAKQRKQGDREDAGHNSTTASLRLKPKAPSATKPERETLNNGVFRTVRPRERKHSRGEDMASSSRMSGPRTGAIEPMMERIRRAGSRWDAKPAR